MCAKLPFLITGTLSAEDTGIKMEKEDAKTKDESLTGKMKIGIGSIIGIIILVSLVVIMVMVVGMYLQYDTVAVICNHYFSIGKSTGSFCDKNPNDAQCLGDWKPDATKEECGLALTRTSIVNGEDAKMGDFPYQAILVFDLHELDRVMGLPDNDDEERFSAGCGGSVINAKYVLTAAHCVQDLIPPRTGQKFVFPV